MCTSRPDHLSWLCQRVLELQPESILDVGIGFGSKGMLFREYTDIWSSRYHREEWKTRIDGVEIFGEYIGSLQREIYDNIFIGNIADIDINYYDFIYLGDVLEHFEKEDGVRVLNKLKTHCKTLIISTPVVVYPQGEFRGNIYEVHRSQWTQGDFEGANIKVINNIMLLEYSTNCFWNERYSTGIISGLGSIGLYREYKWSIISNLSNDLDDIIDIGCGDLSFWEGRDCKNYTGTDVSNVVIERNRKVRPNWKFIASSFDKYIEGISSKVVLCLDTLFHVLSEKVFEETLKNLSLYSTQWIFISTWTKSPWGDKITDNIYQKYWEPDRYVIPGFNMVNKYIWKDNVNCVLCFKKNGTT
jgi:2-polyprenyl-3-methyl-5-hydroxy-6-metoxy-1,4-benzoquinol methylase